MPAFQHTFTRAASFSPRSHAVLLSPSSFTQISILTDAERNTIGVSCLITLVVTMLFLSSAGFFGLEVSQKLLRFRVIRRKFQRSLQFCAGKIGFLLLNVNSRQRDVVNRGVTSRERSLQLLHSVVKLIFAARDIRKAAVCGSISGIHGKRGAKCSFSRIQAPC